jgi:REP element-mobilizing transposase RayT
MEQSNGFVKIPAMSNTIRAYIPGGTYFFTVNLLERRRRLLVDNIEPLAVLSVPLIRKALTR